MGALEMLWVWVYEYVLGPITFIAPLPTSSLYCLSVGNNQSLCPLMWGAQKKSEGAHQKNFCRRFAPALCPHLQIASDATAVVEAQNTDIILYGAQ